MEPVDDGGERVIFLKPEASTYTEAYDGTEGHPAASTRMPAARYLVPSLRLVTDYADNFKHLILPKQRKNFAPPKETLHPELHPELHPIPEDEEDPNAEAFLHGVFKDGMANASAIGDFSGPTNYRDAYKAHRPQQMKLLRGKSTYKYRKSTVIPQTPLPPITSETIREFIHFPNALRENHIFHPDEGASKFPKSRHATMSVTAEEAGRLTERIYNPKYRKNISSGLFHGPPDSIQTRYQSNTAASHSWPEDAKSAQTCKAIRPFREPFQKMATESTHRDHFSGKSIQERYLVEADKCPPLEASSSPDTTVSTFQNCSRNMFWNVAGNLMRRDAKNLEEDESYKEMGELMRKNRPIVEDNLRPMKEAGANRVRRGHVVGVACANAVGSPFKNETTYHEELRWEKFDPTARPDLTARPDPTAQPDPTARPDHTARPNPTARPDLTARRHPTARPDPTARPNLTARPKPHEATIQRLMKQYPDAPTGPSDYMDHFVDHPPQPRPEMIRKRDT
ncbi:hypothetical protein BV898_16604 [Hypsibius exemplaris]|uniref:Uncharacterized protein n=1 Tax=Hypsibius exemplaris TaxID=2072580 RepID=A0A9X6RLA4_HYPEX|nr:hypothetical protein BV898_16604 [Hypsibius exemplaris]